MNRREFLKTSAAGVAASMLGGGYVAYAADQKTYRVGLIGTGGTARAISGDWSKCPQSKS